MRKDEMIENTNKWRTDMNGEVHNVTLEDPDIICFNPWGTIVEHNNAGGHGTREAKEQYTRQLLENHNIIIKWQLPRSPELNVLDLGYGRTYWLHQSTRYSQEYLLCASWLSQMVVTTSELKTNEVSWGSQGKSRAKTFLPGKKYERSRREVVKWSVWILSVADLLWYSERGSLTVVSDLTYKILFSTRLYLHKLYYRTAP